MKILETLLHHFPAELHSNFLVIDYSDGKGEQIIKWNEETLGQKPDKETLQKWHLEYLKNNKWQQIKSDRENQKKKGFLFNSLRYDGNETAQTNIANATLTAISFKLAGKPFSTAWTTFDNAVVILETEDILQLQATMTQAGSNIQDYGTFLRNQINNAQTEEQLDLIVWAYDESKDYGAGEK